MVYNRACRSNPMLKARFLNGVHTGGYAHTFIFTGRNAESMKGGMLMKSKHCTYGEKAAYSTFCIYYLNDNISHKRTIAASGTGSYC